MKNCMLCFIFLMTGILNMYGQSLTVKGKIIAKSDGEPIIGASIVETGTTNGTITDFDGDFTLTVNTGADLTISYLGYSIMQIKAQATLQIIMEEDNQLLDEVVVVGYSTQKKADLTGSITVVSVEELKSIPDTDPMRALQGRVAGMTITADGSPSGAGSIKIRGIGSINSSTAPLFVIDGVPTTATLNSLNTNDIESIQVLKDAASASIYGSRAANGVIIITTKKGKTGEKVKIDFNASLTGQFYASRMKVLNASQYGEVLVQAALNDGLDAIAYASNYGYTVAGTGNSLSDYTITSGLYDGYLNSSKTMRASDTDWFKEISRVGMLQNYDLSLSSGTEKGTMMFSLGYKGADGILKNTDFNSIAARMNTSYNLNKYISIGENFTVTRTSQVDDPGVMENALKIVSIIPVYTEDEQEFGGPIGSMPDRQNPVRQLEQNKHNRMEVWRLFGNAYLDIKPIKGMLFRSNFGLDYDTAFKRTMVKTYYSDIVQNDTPEVTLSQANDTKWNWSNTLNYEFSIKDIHNFTVLGGTEMYKQTRIDFAGNKKEFSIETPEYMWPDAGTGISNVTGNQSGYALISFFGKLDYNYKNRYLASATVRYDGSSRFGKNNRYATFPAFTAGWRISDETFMKNISWIDDLKIRASWGMNGNQAISNTARFGLYAADYGDDRVTSTAYDIYGTGGGIYPSGYRTLQSANHDLKWESATQTDIGLDFILFDQSVYGTIDIYRKNIEDMLIQPAYLASLGEGGASWVNGPSMYNKGFEFSIGYRTTIRKDWRIDINGNMDLYRNKVTSLPETATGSYEHTDTETLVGHAFGSRVGYVTDGLFKTQEEVYASGQTNARVGGIKYVDLNGDGIIDSQDRTWILNPIPAFAYGLNFSLGYKGLDFQMFWQGVCNMDVENVQKYQTDFWSVNDVGSNKGTRLLEAWNPENTNSSIPALSTNNTADEGRFSTYFVENGSYLKLRTLQIGYSFPRALLQKVYMTNARVYLSGQNLLTIKSKSFTGQDPENASWGYPIPTSITVGLQISF